MSLIKKLVRETLLAPVRVVQGVVEAAHDTLVIMEGGEPKRPDERKEPTP